MECDSIHATIEKKLKNPTENEKPTLDDILIEFIGCEEKDVSAMDSSTFNVDYLFEDVHDAQNINNIEVVATELVEETLGGEVEVENNYEENEKGIEYVPDNDLEEAERLSSSETDGDQEARATETKRSRAIKDSWEQRKNPIKRSKEEEYFGRRNN
ncbi:hypothetical protein J6590_098903 [Homalodisca vitripennis]|nr:hypothetical protein J6590_098903 [Homalodisca vitripennis]